MLKKIVKLFIFVAANIIDFSFQNCPTEVTSRGMTVTWHESKPNTSVVSDPLCYYKSSPITRYCNSTKWIPPMGKLQPCLRVTELFDLSSCPPGYEQVSNSNNRYCYQIGKNSTWNYPCLTNGGVSIVTDLTSDEYKSLLQSLRSKNISRYFWLPAQRRKTFSPVVWNIPGPNWGQTVHSMELMQFSAMIKNCLMLDIDRKIVTTEACNKKFPSLCLYLEDMEYPAKCPSGYYGFRFLSDNGTCFGIEYTKDSDRLTFNELINTKCMKPMGDSVYNNLSKYIFMKLAEIDNLPDTEWCFFQSRNETVLENHPKNLTLEGFQVGINSNGSVSLMNPLTTLPCMACETKASIRGDTALELEFNVNDLKLYLTIYYPSGLWKYDNDDIGVQCFSDALGFFTTVNVDYTPFLETISRIGETNLTNVEKTVYSVDLLTNRSAQYWCEAHNKSFSFISSQKLIVSPTSNQLHVFALVINVYLDDNETIAQMQVLTEDLTNLLKAEKVIIMDILEYQLNYITILLHLHVSVTETFEDKASNLVATYHTLQNEITSYLLLNNFSFVNLSSSQYCFPRTSLDYMLLEWELTAIGQVAAPTQFCLQSNGLPVRRNCLGSYLLGGHWSEVEGHCNETYEPSTTTTFLYKFVKGQVPENCTSRFLIDGLGFVLEDVDIIIPADIYYLSMSFQTILNVAQTNDSSVDLGDVENMAWAIDRILLMDIGYLRLSQTFNSTNVILDSVKDIFEKLAEVNCTSNKVPEENIYQLSVKPQFIVQISYPAFNNITGIAVSKLSESDSFNDMIIQPLYANSTIESIISIENLEVATWVPNIVLNTIQKLSNGSNETLKQYQGDDDIHIVINIYHNDAIFQELDPSRHMINSQIIGLTIPGYNTNLVHPIPLLFKNQMPTSSKSIHCSFWNFETKNGGSNPGYWSNQGCFFDRSSNNITVCRCYHMTHFGQLLDIGQLRPGGSNRSTCQIRALNIITLVGSFLSLFGIVGIWITAMVFQTWRKKPSTKVLLQLATAIALPLVFMIVFNLDNTIFEENKGMFVVREHKKNVCVILGSLLQYSILASFMWMLITAILQFIRYVRVLGVSRPSRFMFKFALVGWGVPLIPVILILVINSETYIPDPMCNSLKNICYPNGIYLVIGVIVPVGIVLVINVALFLSVLISISHGPKGTMKTTDLDLIGAQLRLSLFLFFLLGLTWIFGLFSFSKNMLWSYLFCLTSTLQGFVLFIYFVICDPATRSLWVTLMKPQFLTSTSSVSSPRKSISSISSS